MSPARVLYRPPYEPGRLKPLPRSPFLTSGFGDAARSVPATRIARTPREPNPPSAEPRSAATSGPVDHRRPHMIPLRGGGLQGQGSGTVSDGDIPLRVRLPEGGQPRVGWHLPREEVWSIGEHRATGARKHHMANLPAEVAPERLAALGL